MQQQFYCFKSCIRSIRTPALGATNLPPTVELSSSPRKSRTNRFRQCDCLSDYQSSRCIHGSCRQIDLLFRRQTPHAVSPYNHRPGRYCPRDRLSRINSALFYSLRKEWVYHSHLIASINRLVTSTDPSTAPTGRKGRSRS